MQRRYATADVFTDCPLGGNPVAVVLDAAGLSTRQMQALATEFNYSETTFVLPPRDPSHTARVRIFTPAREIPFAGHPNVGTAFVLARDALARREPVPSRFMFEEGAGLVPVELLRDGDEVTGADVTAPEPLYRGATAPVKRVAACLGLAAADLRTDGHAPQVVSVGLRFLAVELVSREALRRIRPSPADYRDVFPIDGALSVYAYTRDAAADGTDLQARMLMLGLTVEDPATGSATAAVAGLLADLGGVADLRLRVGQGVDMGRPSLLLARARHRDGTTTTSVGGACVPMFEGHFVLIGEDRTG